jgi:pyridoxine kinase
VVVVWQFPSDDRMATVLTISSWVARGHVGNSATTFPLMRLGHDVCAMPTVVLAHHPGHAPGPARVDMPDLLAMGSDILTSPTPHPVDAVLVGYVAVAPQVAPIAGLVAEARACKAGIPVLVDPICGDNGALYVDELVALEIAGTLLPLADIVTPNITELAALTAPAEIAEAPQWDQTTLLRRARSLDVATVIVTSAPAAKGRIANLVVTAERVHRVETPRVDTAVKGAGDLLAGLILGHVLSGAAILQATAAAAATVHDVLVETDRRGRDELALASAQKLIVAPRTTANVTAL